MRKYTAKFKFRGEDYETGCYDINMLNACTRLIGENWPDFTIEEHSDSHWTVRYGNRVWELEDVGVLKVPSLVTKDGLKELPHLII